MDKCNKCGKEIRFMRREGKKALVVDKHPVYFVPDSYGTELFIQSGVMRRGTRTLDGLKGYTLHACE